MKKILIFISFAAIFWSCEEEFLNEKPQDFLGSENAYITYEDFNASVNNLYYLVRRQFFERDENRPFDFLYGTDIVYDGENNGSQRHSRMVSAYDPTGAITTTHWNLLYKTLAEANTVISRAETSSMTDEEKLNIISQARFFRGFAYRVLVYLYGGVPLITEEIKEPKVDFVRATKTEVLNQVVSDLEYASQNLPGVTEVSEEGRVCNLVAYHYLAEAYLALGRNTDAITAASVVINDPDTALMQGRFGSRASETPGDVYWDLFRNSNQNRSSGNTEGLWVMQFELDVLGGGLQSGSKNGSYMLERHHGPLIRDVRISGSPAFNWPIGDYTGGRGIGWMISTRYFSNDIWGGDNSDPDFVNDIRNANHNFVRQFVGNRAPYIGTIVDTENPPAGVTVPSRAIYAYQSKATQPFNHPEGLYSNPATYALTSAAGGTYTDQYMLRLAETYLLRAEAYLADGQTGPAADDINVVRSRANASPVIAANVDINYILDERARELGVEEKRRLTLMRLGLLYDRVTAHNPHYVDQGMIETYNLWPIPAAEIERNRGAVLEQNPGYN